nr:unnamed protein product [Digitaria exilis]
MDLLSLLDPLFRSAENHAASVQEPQAAASITTTSLSCPQPHTSGASGRSLSSVSRIWARLEFDWGYTYYIRLDHQGSFHTYPDLGGPYQSLKEAHKAIDRHLDEVRDPKMYKFLNLFFVDEGQPCNGCTTPGNYDMRHPDTSIKLAAGYSDPRCQFGGYIQVPECNDSEDEDTYLREREAELRHMYKVNGMFSAVL